MATWHQKRNPVPLYHSTKWTIVTDPPADMCSLWLESTEEAAKERLKIWESNGRDIRHCYILPPSNKESTI
jgi:hypothetical protein